MSLSKILGMFLAASVVALALLALPLSPAHAQTPTTGGQGKIEGQLVEGSKDAQPTFTNNLTITLHSAAAGATSTISQTTQADSNGKFSFSNLNTITSTRYLLIANYQGVDYFSDILNFDTGQTTMPISVTVFETTTDATVLKISQAHFVIDVQTGEFNVLQIVNVTNSSDRTYIGANPAAGPHRVTLTLPYLSGAQNIEFDNPAANDSTLRGPDSLAYTLPFSPGDDQIVYNYTLPFTPPTYAFSIKVPWDADKFRILLADVGATIQSSQLSAPAPFPTQSGMKFLLSSMDSVKAGTTVNANIVNLPAVVADPSAPPSTTSGAPTAAAGTNNLQLIGGVVLGVAVLAALGLLLVPWLRRRNAASSQISTDTDRRMELLQEMADLDDDYEAKKVSEEDYRSIRTKLKAELVALTAGARGEEDDRVIDDESVADDQSIKDDGAIKDGEPKSTDD